MPTSMDTSASWLPRESLQTPEKWSMLVRRESQGGSREKVYYNMTSGIGGLQRRD